MSRHQEFILSALLEGHSDDVRALSQDPSNSLYSASRDSTARRWQRKQGPPPSWDTRQVYRDHEGFINAVTWLPSTSSSGQGKIITAGQDTLIQVYDLDEGDQDPPVPSQTLFGHMHNVCCLHPSQDGRRLISGSWDCTARIWNTESSSSSWETAHVLSEHGAAVWDVLAVDVTGFQDFTVTACADGLVRLWKGGSRTATLKGHTGPVRALAKVLPDDDSRLFASASNDGTIRICSMEGDCITTLPGHPESFIYSLVSLPSSSGGGLASSGEEGIIKIWNDENGEQDQEILVPALSVWSLAALPNGDLACACSDNLIWIFTRDSARAADAATSAHYTRALEQRKPVNPLKADTKSKVPTSSLSDLEMPGKDGEIKLVQGANHVNAYQWSTSASEWTNLGEVVSEPNRDQDAPTQQRAKMQHDGQEYDFVFSIDVKDDEPALKLPFNNGQDAHEIARRFVAKHELPESYVEQIVEFILASSR